MVACRRRDRPEDPRTLHPARRQTLRNAHGFTENECDTAAQYQAGRRIRSAFARRCQAAHLDTERHRRRGTTPVNAAGQVRLRSAHGTRIVNPAVQAGVLRGTPLPIVIVGAGGIVRNAHLPAYRKGGLPVVAIVDRERGCAQELAAEWSIGVSGAALDSVLPQLRGPLIFDVAVPAAAVLDVLRTVPEGATVLIQKPLGETLAEAESIVALCRERRLQAAVNFQLRWAPNLQAARAITDSGALGTLHDIEVQVSTHTPWELWTFLETAPRLEIVYHSIHYIDLMRSWLRNPQRVYARTMRNPRTPELAATRSVIVLD